MSEFADEPAVAEDGDTTEATAEAPETTAQFDINSPEFLDTLDPVVEQRVQAVLERMAEQAQQPQADQGDELDPYEPGALQQYIRNEIERGVQGRFDEIKPTVEAFEAEQHQRMIDDWCEKIAPIQEAQQLLPEDYEGEPVANAVQFMATGYIPELEARYGRGERAVQTALRMAADQQSALLKAAHQAGYNARNAELQGLSTARAPTPQSVETIGIREEPKNELEAVTQWAARRGMG